MEIAGRVATIDVQTIAVRDLTTEAQDQREKTEVQDLITAAQGRKAVLDRQVKTAVRALKTEAQGRKAVRGQLVKTEALDQ